MTLLSTDSFVRADSTNNPGSTDGAGTFDPFAWTNGNGNLGINGNSFYASAVGGSSLGCAYKDFLTTDIDATVTAGGTSNGPNFCNVLVRYQDSNNLLALGASGFIKCIGGTIVQLVSLGAQSIGDVFRVVAVANNFWVYKNGSLLFQAQESYLEHSTKHGLCVLGINARLTAWSCSTVASPHNYQVHSDSGVSVSSPFFS